MNRSKLFNRKRTQRTQKEMTKDFHSSKQRQQRNLPGNPPFSPFPPVQIPVPFSRIRRIPRFISFRVQQEQTETTEALLPELRFLRSLLFKSPLPFRVFGVFRGFSFGFNKAIRACFRNSVFSRSLLFDPSSLSRFELIYY